MYLHIILGVCMVVVSGKMENYLIGFQVGYQVSEYFNILIG